MKSVLRSVFDPLPRQLSPGAQMLVVGLLVVGITISVLEYLESSRPGSLAKDPSSGPARLEAARDARQPSEVGNKPRSFVRATPPASKPAVTPTGGAAAQSFPALGREPGPAGAAPMSFQPGEDG